MDDADDLCPKEAEDRDGFEDADGCPDGAGVSVRVTRKTIELLGKIDFELDSADVQFQSFPLLTQVADVLRRRKEITELRVEGHTDAAGFDDHDMVLSQMRAEAVTVQLVKAGVDPIRLVPKGFGETQPAVPNEGWGENKHKRRVVFTITEMKGVARPLSY